MRSSRRGLLLLSGLVFSAPLAAQPPQRDPQAILVLTQSLGAMGGAVLASTRSQVLARSNITFLDSDGEKSGTLTTKAQGTARVRLELVVDSRTTITILRRPRAQVVEEDGLRRTNCPASFPFRANHLPFLSPLAEFGSGDASVRYVGLESVGGVPAHHIVIRREFSKWIAEALPTAADYHVFVDAGSLRLLKSVYYAVGLRKSVPALRVEDTYFDYRPIGGFVVPFRVERSLTGISVLDSAFSQKSTPAVLLSQTQVNRNGRRAALFD